MLLSVVPSATNGLSARTRAIQAPSAAFTAGITPELLVVGFQPGFATCW